MGMTIAEKILAKHSGNERVAPGDFVTCKIDFAMSPDGERGGLTEIQDRVVKAGVKNGLKKIWDPNRFLFALDHHPPICNARIADIQRTNRGLVERYGVTYFYDINEGIGHQLMPERGHVHPGDLLVGKDSHATTYGALNAASTAMGPVEMSYVLTTGGIWFMVPETIRFNLKGKMKFPLMSKDIFLHVVGKYGPDVAIYKSIEWVGAVADQMSIDGRLCISCQSVELGAKFGIFEADKKTIEYVRARSKTSFAPVKSDPDATYEKEMNVDVDNMEPLVALPHGFEVVKPVSKLEGIKLDAAKVGACSNGRLEDLAAMARILKGKKVRARTYATPASKLIFKDAIENGIISTLVDAGVVVTSPGCSPCESVVGALAPGEVCISATTRGFQGRMGSPEAKIYIASPTTVAASALKGEITDPRKVI